MLLVVGQIGKAHGIRGEVLVTVRTDDPERRFLPGAVFTTASGKLVLESKTLRWHQGKIIAQFEGVKDRNAAEELRSTELQVESADLPEPEDPDEFLDHQLVGLRVVTVGGEDLGAVARIDHAPSSDLLVLAREGGGTALIPFVTAMVPTVDLPGGRVIVDLPEGLLDL